MISTEDIVLADECQRKLIWNREWELPRVTLSYALNQALRKGLLEGTEVGKQEIINLASNPGLSLNHPQLYDIVMHHAALVELLVSYLAPEGKWEMVPAVDGFQPLSFSLPDGRIRRVVLCASWDELRRMEEINSWRTFADTISTNRSMLINAIVIGGLRNGFRPSPWTRGYIHPRNGTLRLQRREGEEFSGGWEKVWRERADFTIPEWLAQMQKDRAFDSLVHSVTVDPPRRKDVRRDFDRLLKRASEPKDEMRRAACFRFSACEFAAICHHEKGITPREIGWKQKENASLSLA